MCQIIAGPSIQVKTILLNNQPLIDELFDNNSDGWGAMYHTAEGVRAIKQLPKTAADTRKYIEALPQDERPVALHWRMRTSGNIDTHNAHPHFVEGGWLIHNGILRNVDMSSDPRMCDTIHFSRQYLDGNVEAIVRSPRLQTMIGDFIENNRFVLMSDAGEMCIINKEQGYEVNGVWVANTYASSRSLIDPSYTKRHVYSYKDFTRDLDAYKPYHYDTTWWPEDEDAEDEASLADDVYAALDDYDEQALTALLRDHAGTAVNLILNEFEVTLYKNATDLDHATQAVVDAWIGYDDAYLVNKCRTNPSFVAQALLYNCDFEWCGVETPSR